MDEAADIFFKPRATHIQGRLDFLQIPPERLVAFPVEALEFDGINLHWNGSESCICLDPATCPLHARGVPVRPYFYAPAYLYCFGTKDWKPYVLPIGMEVATFAKQQLRGQAWKVKSRSSTQNRKKGVVLSVLEVSDLFKKDILALEPFDVRPRLLQRYQLA